MVCYTLLEPNGIHVGILTYGVEKILQRFLRIDVPARKSHCARSKVLLIIK